MKHGEPMMGRGVAILGGPAAAAWLALSASPAQSNPIYVPLGQAKGALYKPDSGPAPHVAIFRMRRTADGPHRPDAGPVRRWTGSTRRLNSCAMGTLTRSRRPSRRYSGIVYAVQNAEDQNSTLI